MKKITIWLKKQNKYKKILLYILLFIFISVIGFFVTFGLIYPIDEKLDEANKNHINTYHITYVDIDDVNKDFVKSVLMTEDRRFYSHNGIDTIGVLRAIKTNVFSGQLKEGASTITQQLVKNTMLTHDRTFERKFKELFLSLATDTYVSKDEILENYINVIYYGNNVYGVENASQFYFGKSSAELTIEEATLLAGIPNAPNAYEPINHYDLAKKRQKKILKNLIDTNYITQKEADEIFDRPLQIMKH